MTSGTRPATPTRSPADCFKDNRAEVHLHGGNTPWISDGTPHQWITPANEDTPWPQGVSVRNVPDMADPGPGAQTFYYTNQQSARLMFYHDHSWGITRLNVYAGEAAGYVLRDAAEQKLIDDGIIPGAAEEHPARSSRTAPSFPTMPSSRRRIRPGTSPGGAASATCGTTTCTCPPRTPATPAA